MKAPLIHLNGTSGDRLVEVWRDATKAVRLAKEAVEGMDINQRDYYPLGDQHWQQARDRWVAVQKELTKLHQEFHHVLAEVARQNVLYRRGPTESMREMMEEEVLPLPK